MIFLFCNRHIRILYNMFKIKRNYEIETKYSGWKMLRCIKRYKPTKLKYAIFINKMNNTI